MMYLKLIMKYHQASALFRRAIKSINQLCIQRSKMFLRCGRPSNTATPAKPTPSKVAALADRLYRLIPTRQDFKTNPYTTLEDWLDIALPSLRPLPSPQPRRKLENA